MSEVIKSEARIDPTGSSDISGMIGLSQRYALLNKLVIRDLNSTKGSDITTFGKFTKEDIAKFLKDPSKNRNELRDAIEFIYSSSPHFRRLIQYFTGLSDLSFVVSPYQIDPKKVSSKTVNNNYRSVLNTMSAFDVKTQFAKILTVCLREDTFYGTMWVTSDSITIQQLPSKYCNISTIEGNVLNVTFDFSYFDKHPELVDLYPKEFRTKYELYKRAGRSKNKAGKWQELDSPTSFAVKCNTDILSYPMPPFAGILREVYDLEEYKQLKLTKTTLENYAILVMTLGINDQGDWQMDFQKAKEFWQNLDSVLPDEIGSVLTPMPIEKISFERAHPATGNTISEAEQNLFSAAGVSSLLFNNDKASANALTLSIKADQAITYGIVKSIEGVVNRYIQAQKYGKNFKITFLDCSPFNRKEVGDMYLKACQFGIPMISYYAASQGLNQAELDSMSFLETEVLGLTDMFKPLQSSTNMKAPDDSKGATDEGGAPPKDMGELSESGEQNREDA